MTTRSKGIFGSVATTIVVVVAYLCSYSYFGGHHSQFYFASGESIFLVPDTATQSLPWGFLRSDFLRDSNAHPLRAEVHSTPTA